MTSSRSPSISSLPLARGFDLVPILWQELKNEYPQLQEYLDSALDTTALLNPKNIQDIMTYYRQQSEFNFQKDRQLLSLLHKIRKTQLKQLEDTTEKAHKNKLFFFIETAFGSLESGGITDVLVTAALKVFHAISAIGAFTAALMAGIGGAVVYTFKGTLGLAEIAKVYCDTTIKQRKTRYGTALASTILAGIAIAIFAGAMTAPPIAIPFILLGITGMGMYKELYILKQTASKLNRQIALLEETRQQLVEIILQEEIDKNTDFLKLDPRIIRLTYELTHQKHQAEILAFNKQQIIIRTIIRSSALIGTITLITAALLLLQALTLMGVAIMLSVGLANVICKAKERTTLKEINSEEPRDVTDYEKVLHKTHHAAMQQAPQPKQAPHSVVIKSYNIPILPFTNKLSSSKKENINSSNTPVASNKPLFQPSISLPASPTIKKKSSLPRRRSPI